MGSDSMIVATPATSADNAESAGAPILGLVAAREAGADASARDALAAQVRGVAGVTAATAALLFDALAAIAFAAGLAGSVAALASGAATAPWLVLLLGAAVARGACAWAFARAGAAAAATVKARARRAVVTAALHGAVATTTSPSNDSVDATSGAFLGLAVDDVEALDAHASRFVPTRRAAVLAPLLVLFAAAFASPIAAVILIATLLPFAVLIALAGSASAGESRRQFAALARLSGLFADRLRALPVVLACAAERRETARLAAAADAVATRTLAVLRLAFLSSAVLEFFAALCVALIAVYAGFQLLGLLPLHVPERLDLFRTFFVLALAPEFYLPMRRLAAAYHDRQAAQTATERLLAGGVGDDTLPAVAPGETAGASRSPAAAAPRLRVEGLTIRWPGADAPLVAGLSFDVAPGRILALVGPSGSGKTSVLRALLALAPVTAGGWRLDDGDGVPLADANDRFGGRRLAALAAWVGQAPLVVPGTLRHNLRLVAPDADDAAVAAALRAAGLDALVAGRAGGLDARLDARGGGLSGGERRRLAVARALLKQAPLWLLDEPTAHLDAASEDALVATLREALRGRTVLVATHSERLAAIADVVVRLDEGRP
jgi:ATP-binding cassette subfamily C protein CydD